MTFRKIDFREETKTSSQSIYSLIEREFMKFIAFNCNDKVESLILTESASHRLPSFVKNTLFPNLTKLTCHSNTVITPPLNTPMLQIYCLEKSHPFRNLYFGRAEVAVKEFTNLRTVIFFLSFNSSSLSAPRSTQGRRQKTLSKLHPNSNVWNVQTRL